jgi:hypothetical protein
MRLFAGLLVVIAAPFSLAATPSLKDVKSNVVPGAYIAQFNPEHVCNLLVYILVKR